MYSDHNESTPHERTYFRRRSVVTHILTTAASKRRLFYYSAPTSQNMKAPHMTDPKIVLDFASTLVAISTVAGWVAKALPPLAALVSILWIVWQWYHSAPMKATREKRKKGRVK